MIVSHTHKFIFIKTRKTGGSSIEKILFPFLDPNVDVCTGSDYDGTPRTAGTKGGHKSAEWIELNFPEQWKTYFKFTIVRNPWDCLVSYYYWYRKGPNPKIVSSGSFEEFIKKVELERLDDWPRYTKNNIPVVDAILKQESLHDDFKKLDLGIPYNDELLTVFEKGNLREVDGYRQMYSEETKNIVAEKFSKMIEYFGYEF